MKMQTENPLIKPEAAFKLSVKHALLPAVMIAPVMPVEITHANDSVSPAPTRQAFSIPSQALDDALNAFIAATDWQIGFTAAQTRGLKSKALKGVYTREQALRKLLEGTGINYRFIKPNSITLENRPTSQSSLQSAIETDTTLKPMTVSATYDSTDPYNPDYTRPNASTATKTDTPIMETPYSIRVVPQQVLKDQQAVRVDDALRNVSGVIRNPNIGNGTDNFVIRGFSNNNWTFRDGFLIPDVLGGAHGLKQDMANIERVEVLKGPGSLLYGRAEPGGIINLVTKQPLATPYYALQQQFGSFDFYRTTLDATGPITQNNSLLYRVNLAYENSDSFRQFVEQERVLVAPVVRWNVSAQTQVTFELQYLHSDIIPDGIGVPVLGNRPAPVSRERSLSEPWAREQLDDILVGINWSHAFNDDWKLRHRFYANFEQMGLNRNSFVGGRPAASDGTLMPLAGSLPGLGFNRYFNTVDLTGKFETGVAKHTLLVGGDYYRLDEFVAHQFCCAELPSINIFSPTHTSVPPLALFNGNDFGEVNLTTDWYGLFFQDQVKLPYGFHALGGFRYDSAKQYDNLGNKTAQDDSRLNPRGGLLWRPVQWLSLYGSYTENFGVSNGLNTNRQPLPPQTAQQWETGVKTEFWDGRLISTIAYFNLTKQNLSVPDPTNPLLSRSIGEAESRGIELDAAGEILPGWRMIASYAYTPFAEITKDVGFDGGPGNQGHRLNNVPRHSGNLWSTFEFEGGDLQGFKFGVGVSAVGQRQGNNQNTYQMPGYVTANLLASYGLKIGPTKLTTQLNVNNLLDKAYFSGSDANFTTQYGVLRTFMGSLRLEY